MTSYIDERNGRITFYFNGYPGITIVTDYDIKYIREVIEMPGLYPSYAKSFIAGEETIEINFVIHTKDALIILDRIRAGALTHYICVVGKDSFSVSCKVVQSYDVVENGARCDFVLRTIGGMMRIDKIIGWQEVYKAIMSERGQRTFEEMSWKI